TPDIRAGDCEMKNEETVPQLRKMVLGQVEHSPAHKQPGKYLALDCEMVGVGLDGAESALARVSLVNFHGAVLLDAFVRPKERVVDYRTQFSGIRPSDMPATAKPFEEVQQQVADLLKDRILVGHAVHNDLKALLLSHPRSQTRDTQSLSHKHKLPSARGRRPALRHLVQTELGLAIQTGEHSSVTDARATMALFRLHRKTWEKDFRPFPRPSAPSSSSRPRSTSPALAASTSKTKAKGKAKASPAPDDASAFPGGGRRGVSSGLSTVVKRLGGGGKDRNSAKSKSRPNPQKKWWTELSGG
ncbi:ribonuclease H-like domain-containing protein, partial [Trametes elegans]